MSKILHISNKDAGENHVSNGSVWTYFTWCLPVGLLACAWLSLSYDIPVSRFFQSGQIPGFLREIVENTEPFGHGIGVVILMMTCAIVHRERSGSYVYAGAIALGAGLCTNVLKFGIGRSRPRDLDLANLNLSETFSGWFPYLNGVTTSQSFPSGHTTVAWALAAVFCHLHPHARMYFIGLAMFVGYGRVQCSAHFPSDVLVGAALGWTVASVAVRRLPVAFENHNQKKTSNITTQNSPQAQAA
ncbi:phosphatase PAP2 family protein [Rubinisphaera italica]|uniref:Phosphatidylglycerophosphatase B n=1 Tax=Rubinisphaera italica TaxID=2527969 RepID=A0A5C5XHS0_9PLAN|nr:phosphatase PAP2 family protein [Rubinisphaera italica]TWT62238.1 phosphatidylglycerophosphatase B [Rubinisphaera italica]